MPLAALAGLGILALAKERREQTERAGLEVTRALATAVEVELGRSIAVLQGLAIGPALDSGDLRRYHASMQRALATRPDWVTITLADGSGQTLANARRPFGEPPGMVLDLPSHRAAVSTRAPVVGRLTQGPRGEVAVPVRVPVVRDGEVRFVLTAALKPDTFVQVLERQRLPGDWVVSVFDGEQHRVARSRRHAEFLGHPPSPTLRKMMAEANGEEATGLTEALEGDEIYTAFTRSRPSGWSVAIGIPSTLVQAGERRSLLVYGSGLLVSLALAAGLAVLLARAVRAHEAEREELLRREREARGVAERASRAKDEFLAMLGHELRNPLGALSNAIWLLKDPAAAPEMAERAKDIVARQTDHLRRLTDDLLDAARAMLGKIVLHRSPLDLALAAARALDALQAAGRLAAHRVERALEPAWIDADYTRVEQIVANLLSNALKYTPPGGSIRVQVRRQGEHAVLAVTDDGAGMPGDLVPRVFDPFVQGDRELDRSHGGLGIGLTLVRRLAELHGGSASAASDGPGSGSRFTVRFPAIEPPAAAAGPRSDARPAARSREILLVEDNEDALVTLRALLVLAGHRVRIARDGSEGLAALQAQPPEVALIDIGLPGMDGYEVARRARQAAGAVDGARRPFLVALTGYGLPEDRARAVASGFDEHLVKPVDPAALAQLLARISA